MNYLLPAYRQDGKVVSSPVIITMDADGAVTSHRHFSGHEPHSTAYLNAMLDLDAMRVVELKVKS